MKRVVLLFALVAMFTAAALPAAAQADPACPGSLVPQLYIGATGYITERFSTLRQVPAGDYGNKIIYSPATFTVIDGPVCAGTVPIWFWQIDYGDGNVGWAAESQVYSFWGWNEYWLAETIPGA